MLRTMIGAALFSIGLPFIQGCAMPWRSAESMSAMDESQDIDDLDVRELSRPTRPSHQTAEIAQVTRTETEATPQTTPPATLDAATLFLIESELRDLSPAEREQWMARLRSVDPQHIPYMLQTRRMMVDAADPSPPTTTAAGSDWPAQRHAQTAGTAVARQPDAGGGAMSRMHLNAPEPSGASATTSPFAIQPRPTFHNTVADARLDANSLVAQSVHETGGPLPTISPGMNGRAADPAANRNQEVIITNFESTPVSVGQQTVPDQDAYLQEALQRVIALTEAEVAAADPGYTEEERTEYVRRHVALRMLQFISQQPHRAQQAIPDLDPAEQEFWTELFWALSNYFDTTTTPDPAERAALATFQLGSASRHLQHQAQLQLWNTSFCHEISSFGNFATYDRDEFRPGETVLLYAEIRNFDSQPTSSGHFRTQMKSHIEIRRGGIDGERIEYNSFDPTEDLCRAPRNDYFHSYKIDLPHHLRPGPHALVLTVEDMLSGKIATEVLDFVVR